MPILTNNLTLKMKRDFAEVLMKEIEKLIAVEKPIDDKDKLLLMTLNEVSWIIYKRLASNVIDFSIKVSATQSMALRSMYTDYICDPTSWFGNGMHRIANHVHKQINY